VIIGACAGRPFCHGFGARVLARLLAEEQRKLGVEGRDGVLLGVLPRQQLQAQAVDEREQPGRGAFAIISSLVRK
jgi:hypothetical protein